MPTPPFFTPKEGYALILTMLMDELGVRTDAPAKAIVASTFLVLKRNGEAMVSWTKQRKLIYVAECRLVAAGKPDHRHKEWPAKAEELLVSNEAAASEDMLRAIRMFKRDLTDEAYAEAFEIVKTKLSKLEARKKR